MTTVVASVSTGTMGTTRQSTKRRVTGISGQGRRRDMGRFDLVHVLIVVVLVLVILLLVGVRVSIG